ncbi:hypothetical protein JCM15831A_12430 [Asaia astilbis]|uniref:hypothetical protein n=1 Tax=Asaia astilbis TaxID=610244 RepID=UPI000A017E68|nr:hypothetical protein [Asaia astilbis]
MWDEPYLETCCRSTLHRALLCEGIGRPQNLRDQPCLERLSAMGFVKLGADGRFHITPSGLSRHDQEIGQLKPMRARASQIRV